MREKCIAIVLAAGQGKRMGSCVQKQFLQLKGKPLIYYALKQFQESEFIDEIILVTGTEEIPYCQEEIVEKYHFDKVQGVIAGGKERYHSVYEGLKWVKKCDYVFIHDGARPFVDAFILRRAYEAVKTYQACVVGMPVKDTIKLVNDEQWAIDTPDRQNLWQIQTPQVFDYSIIKKAYDIMIEENDTQVTDDAMVLERFGEQKVKLVEGSYKNIKITTPEDLLIAEVFCD
ncbi:MAG TPA: 2-C-methyl-D-erythritol 4-phosphate cytidylyltransferase [Candidatus Merdenecus merdavium]|nr:2-C-methyl-D-erythritol 4-phosphate cytidylyltransferase [Candidatus Merdenecus merdavium]